MHRCLLLLSPSEARLGPLVAQLGLGPLVCSWACDNPMVCCAQFAYLNSYIADPTSVVLGSGPSKATVS
jgi:hypothetical protein